MSNKKISIPAAKRRYMSFELALKGYTLRDIQAELGCSHTQARRDIQRVLLEMRPPYEDVEHHRRMLLSRYEQILKRMNAKIDGGNILHEPALYDRILRTLNQIADITGVKEKQQVQTPNEMDLAAYADLLEQADSQ